MALDVNKISVQEKREIAILTRSKYDKLIADLRQTEDHVMEDLITKIQKALKVDAILLEIKHLEEKKLLLESKIKNMGFDSYGRSLEKSWSSQTGGYDINYSTPAGKLYFKMTKARPDIRNLEVDRDREIANIWLSTEKSEVRKIFDSKINVKQLEFKPKK